MAVAGRPGCLVRGARDGTLQSCVEHKNDADIRDVSGVSGVNLPVAVSTSVD
jgi:hypothetical protein